MKPAEITVVNPNEPAMKKTAFALLLSLCTALPALAADPAGDLTASSPWARATPQGAKNGAAYLSLRNTGSQDDALLAARGDVAERIELHTHINDNGVMKMRQVADIPLKAGQTTELKPGSYHIMLIGLKKPLAEGARIPLTLEFRQARPLAVEVEVGPVNSLMAPAGHAGHAMH